MVGEANTERLAPPQLIVAMIATTISARALKTHYAVGFGVKTIDLHAPSAVRSRLQQLHAYSTWHVQQDRLTGEDDEHATR